MRAGRAILIAQAGAIGTGTGWTQKLVHRKRCMFLVGDEVHVGLSRARFLSSRRWGALRKRRLALKLKQRQGGRTARCHGVVRLELGIRCGLAEGSLYAAVIEFHGYNPLPEAAPERARRSFVMANPRHGSGLARIWPPKSILGRRDSARHEQRKLAILSSAACDPIARCSGLGSASSPFKAQ
jgi:hypothetical protein